MKRKIAILFVIALLVVVNFSIWSYINNPLQLQPWTKTTMGVTYDPMRKQDSPTSNTYPSEANMDRDTAEYKAALDILSQIAHRLRKKVRQ